jgi:hypothetical protein
LDTGVDDAVDHTLVNNVVIGLGIERNLAGTVGSFIEEDSSDAGVFGSICVDVGLNLTRIR